MPGVVLKKGRQSAALRRAIEEHHGKMGINSRYIKGRLRDWAANGALCIYRAIRKDRAVGWIVYNSDTSTVEEMVPAGSTCDRRTFFPMLDALIARESLVAIEVPEADTEKYALLLDYGFRPTRHYTVHGLPVRTMDLSTVVYFERVKGLPPARPYRRKERVAIERVPETRTQDEITGALETLFDRLGGIGRFVKPGQTVVLKPNVVADHGMKDGHYVGGVVTDRRVLEGLIRLLLPVARKVIVAEGSSINRSATAKMFAHYGYETLTEIDPKKVSLVDLNSDRVIEKRVPLEKRMAMRKVPVTIDKADVLISVPVLKTHFAAGVSLAVKNLQGAMPPLEKYMTHFFGLWQNLVNIHRVVKPALTIIDGLTGQEDFGPVSGTPKTMNVLVGGANPVAVDAVAARVMGFNPASSLPVLLAYLQGLGPIEEDRITVVGTPIAKVASPFKQPAISVAGGKQFVVHDGGACPGCRGYLHFVLSKLRKSDPVDPSRLLIDRPFHPQVNIFLGPRTERDIEAKETNIFMGICQQHHAESGKHLPGCPPHAEVIMNGIFQHFPDVERPKYADETEEAKLEKMLREVLSAR